MATVPAVGVGVGVVVVVVVVVVGVVVGTVVTGVDVVVVVVVGTGGVTYVVGQLGEYAVFIVDPPVTIVNEVAAVAA